MNHRILIVDDEPNIVVSLEFMMRRECFEVSSASDGEKGLALGADAYMAKPFSTRELVEKVRALLES